MKRLASAAAAAIALAAAPQAAALCAPTHTITPTADGPSPHTLEVLPQALVGLPLASQGPWSRLVFETLGCEVQTPVPAGAETTLGCPLVEPGSYPFRVEGYGAGTGLVVVRPVVWVTLAARSRTVVFGEAATLGGTVYAGLECGPPPVVPASVEVAGQPFGGRSFRRTRRIVPRGETGRPAWRAEVRPWIRTAYRATWQGRPSATVVVDVRPRVTLRRSGKGMLTVSARSLRAYGGRWISIQRRVAGGWRFVRAVRLGPAGSARFGSPRAVGALRAYLPRSQAGRGYVAGFSAPLSSR